MFEWLMISMIRIQGHKFGFEDKEYFFYLIHNLWDKQLLEAELFIKNFHTWTKLKINHTEQRNAAPLGGANLFKLTYTPLELATLAVLSISNPITLIQLYRRHKRKMALRM
jgi:hypothetical protein